LLTDEAVGPALGVVVVADDVAPLLTPKAIVSVAAPGKSIVW
jgi:hypothetical protein